MSFQIFVLVGHLTNFTVHNLLNDNTSKKITEDVMVKRTSDHVQSYCENLMGRTFSKFGWTMFDDQLLFSALGLELNLYGSF